MRVLGAAEAREADARTIAAGTPGIVLMERASEAVARECVRAIEASPLRGERVVVLCGTGNNGGDGFGAARLLRRSPVTGEVAVLLVGARGKVSGDAAEMLRRLENEGGPSSRSTVPRVSSRSAAPRSSSTPSSGRAFRGLLEEASLHALAVRLASSRRAFVVAVDVPSGLDSGSGRSDVPHVRADLTVTFGFPKLAHLLAPAAGSCGRVVVADIGLLPDEGDVRCPGGGHRPRRRAVLSAATGRRAQGDVRDARHRRRRLGNGGGRGARGPRRLPVRSREGGRRRGGGEPRGDSRTRGGGHDRGAARSRRADGARRRAGARDVARFPRCCSTRPSTARSRPFSTPTR